jgi:Protein of unknown function (DUF2911)
MNGDVLYPARRHPYPLLPILPMKRLSVLATAAMLALVTAHARAQQPTPPAPPPLRIAASSFATVEVHLNARQAGGEWYEEDAALTGPSRIAISYGQPHARGRAVEGGLVPRDNVWRFGANAATTLHTDLDITLGTLKLARGDYSLFMLYTGSGWQLIVNRGTGQWGTDRDASKDIGRVALASRALAEPEESLTIYLVPNSPRPRSGYAELAGVLRIKWGRTELSAPWSVDR